MEGRKPGKKAILIEGVRPVGKTTFVKAFQEYISQKRESDVVH